VLWLEDSLSVSTLLDAPLIAAPLPTAISAVGAVYLLVRRGVRWWTRAVPLALFVGAVVAGLAEVVVADFRPFSDLLPVRILLWIGVAAAGCSLAWANMQESTAGTRRRDPRLSSRIARPPSPQSNAADPPQSCATAR
jgi:hypothetical protein